MIAIIVSSLKNLDDFIYVQRNNSTFTTICGFQKLLVEPPVKF